MVTIPMAGWAAARQRGGGGSALTERGSPLQSVGAPNLLVLCLPILPRGLLALCAVLSCSLASSGERAGQEAIEPPIVKNGLLGAIHLAENGPTNSSKMAFFAIGPRAPSRSSQGP
jgi:hypothetical protein